MFFLVTGFFGVLACCGAAKLRIEKQQQNRPDKSIVQNRLTLGNGMAVGGGGTETRDASVKPDVTAGKLAPQSGRAIRIFAKGLGIAIAQDLHHPVIEVIDGMAKNRLKTPTILFMSLLDIISQTYANVSMLAPQKNLVGAEHLDILHGNFGDAIGSPVQVLFLWKQRRDIERRGRGRKLFYGVRRRMPRRFNRNLREVLRALPFHVRYTRLLNRFRWRGV
jgi:hypothetical protein